MLKSEKGSAIIVTMIMVTVLTLTGFALWNYSMSETRIADREVKRMQAHYLALSGAESVAAHIIEQQDDSVISGLAVGAKRTSNDTSLGEGTFTVSVTRKAADDFLVEATGKVGGVEDSVTLTITRSKEEFAEIFNRAVFSTGRLDISHTNANVYGDVESNQEIIGNPDIGNKYEYSERVFSDAEFPRTADLLTLPNISSNTSNTITINEDTITINAATFPGQKGIYIDNVTIQSQGSLVFNIPKGRSFIFKTNQYSNKGITEVTGGGVLLMFVTHSCEMKTPHASSSESLIIFMADNTVFTLQAGGAFNGYLYGPHATAIIQSSPSTVRGAIITGGLYGNLAEARFIGTVEHQIRENLNLEMLGSYFPQRNLYEIKRWGN